jgi:N-dimethylarginine dimethylaminohydrolase
MSIKAMHPVIKFHIYKTTAPSPYLFLSEPIINEFIFNIFSSRMAALKVASNFSKISMAPWYKTVMMCRPKFFDVRHRLLNAHMDMTIAVKKNLALTQWENAYKTLLANNIKVDLLEPHPDLPDMVFTANAGIVHGNKAVVSSFGAVPRQPETHYHIPFFKERGFEVINPIDDGVEIEGCGDFMPTHDGENFFVAYGFRSSFKAYAYLKDVLSLPKDRLHHMKLMDPYFYHIDTALMSLTHGHLMYYPGAFDKESDKKILDVGGDKTIAIGKEDAMDFACNSVNFEESGEHIIVGNKFSDVLKDKLTNFGYKVIETPYQQFLLAGGSIRCSVLDIGKSDEMAS